MTDNASAAAIANSVEEYDKRRTNMNTPDVMNPSPVAPLRLFTTMRTLAWCWTQQPDVEMAVLDVAAGVGNLGQYARSRGYEFKYHTTEQSELEKTEIKFRVPGTSFAQWRCEPGGKSLRQALGDSEDLFLPAYPTVLLSHGLEHHADQFKIMDECWDMVRPGGFLVLISAREHLHRTHFRTYDLDALAAVAAHYTGPLNPICVLPGDYFTDLYVMIPKPSDATPEVFTLESNGEIPS